MHSTYNSAFFAGVLGGGAALRSQISRDQIYRSKKMAEKPQKGEGVASAPEGSSSAERVVRVNAEDYSLDRKDYVSVKVICLGDSAVGKSK